MDSKRYLVGSVSKALAVLDLFDAAHPERTLTELAREMDTLPGTLFPVLRTLEHHNYLAKDPVTKRYRLGLKLLAVVNHLFSSLDVREQAKPVLQELAVTLGANAHLALPYEFEVLYLERREAAPSVVINSAVGRRVPLHCTALGKVLSAHSPYLEEWVLSQPELPAITRCTVTDPAELKAQFAEIREQGFALEFEEFHEGNACVAAPIRDYRGQAFAALSISIVKVRLESEPIEGFIDEVVRAALCVSESLGYVPGV